MAVQFKLLLKVIILKEYKYHIVNLRILKQKSPRYFNIMKLFIASFEKTDH